MRVAQYDLMIIFCVLFSHILSIVNLKCKFPFWFRTDALLLVGCNRNKDRPLKNHTTYLSDVRGVTTDDSRTYGFG